MICDEFIVDGEVLEQKDEAKREISWQGIEVLCEVVEVLDGLGDGLLSWDFCTVEDWLVDVVLFWFLKH